MTTQIDPADLSAINNALGVSTLLAIETEAHPDVKRRRGIDFQCIDNGLAAAKRLVATLGPDTLVPGRPGETARGLLIQTQEVVELAAPYRPKAQRA